MKTRQNRENKVKPILFQILSKKAEDLELTLGWDLSCWFCQSMLSLTLEWFWGLEYLIVHAEDTCVGFGTKKKKKGKKKEACGFGGFCHLDS